MSQPTHAAPAAPPQLAGAIAAYLAAFWPSLPPQHIQMQTRGAKYKWVKTDPKEGEQEGEHIPLDQQALLDHAAGKRTIGAKLQDDNDRARVGKLDIDEGGRPAIVRALVAAEQLGLVAYAIVMPGEPHDGGRVVVVYDDFYPVAHIRAQMLAIVKLGGLSEQTEIWPCSQAVALPFGYHVRKRTRGELVLQTGESIALDLDLAAGFAAVRALPLNPAPPEPAPPPRPAAPARPAGAAQVISLVQPRQARPGERIDTAAIAAEVRDRFNRETDWGALLGEYGGQQTRDGWRCNCGFKHAHDTQIAITSQGKIVSYSPNCGWAPHKDSGRALDKLGFYIDQAHRGNYRAAIEALARQYGLWVEPRKARQEAPTPAPQPEQRSEAARAAYNAQRREQRHTEARQALDRTYNQVRLLDLSDRAHLLFAYLHQRATDAGALQVAPTNEQLAADLGFCRRYVIYAFRELEAAGIGKRTGGKGGLPGQPNEAATWTFYRAPNLVCKPHQNAECTLSYIESNSIPTLETSEGGPQPPTPEPLAEWECWQPADSECSGYDLDLEAAPAVEQPALVELPAGWRIVRPARGPWCWAATEGAMTATHPRDTSDQVLIVAAWSKAAALAEVRAVEPIAEQEAPAQPENTRFSGIKLDQEAPAGPGASYDAGAALQLGGEYTARPKDLLDFVEQWEAVTRAIKVRNAPDVPQAQTIDLLDPRHAEQEDPLVRAAPVEPAAAARYWSLKGKLKKATSSKQILFLRRQIADLEIWRPASELVAERAGVGDARASQARRAAGPPLRAPGQQALLFGGAD